MIRQQIRELPSGGVEYCDVGEGMPVLYFHGTGAGNEAAVLLERELVAAGCRLIVPNRPGYGKTSLGARGRADHCAWMAAELLDDLQLNRVAVVGTSGGGMPAAAFARLYPHRASALILQCAQSHRWDERRWLPTGIGAGLYLFQHRFFYPLLKMYNRFCAWSCQRKPLSCLRGMSGAAAERLAADEAVMAVIEKLVAMTAACAARPQGIENDWRILVGDNGVVADSISCPTLIIHDRGDPLVPFGHAEWSHAAIPNSEILEVSGCGHLIWFGPDRRRMQERRMEFLRAHAAPSRGVIDAGGAGAE